MTQALLPSTEATPTDQCAATLAEVPPWKRSFFYCATGEVPTLLWMLFIHSASLVGLVVMACGLLPLPTWPVLATAFIMLFLGGLGTTVAYHRAIAHRAVRLNVVVEQLLVLFAVLNGSGKPRTWVAMHRLHHTHSDKEGDISSPIHGGFMWAHLRWLWQIDPSCSDRYAKDLQGPRYTLWGRLQVPLLALSIFGGAALAIGGTWQEAVIAALFIGPVRLVWALHAQCTVNSICHLGKVADVGGTSRNLAYLTPLHLGQGENWHANHHRRPADARLGQGWQLDVGWWSIAALRLFGLATLKGDGKQPD